MKNFLWVSIIAFGLFSCTQDTDLTDVSQTSVELAAKSSSENVKLLRAWTSNSSSPVRQRYVRRFVVKVKNLAFQKQVAIHHATYNNGWVDIPLTYQQSIDKDEEIWVGEVEPDTEFYSDEFVVKYTVDGQTYWDNNGGANYSMLVNQGAYLADGVEIMVDSYYTRFSGTYFNINADIKRDYGSAGSVEVVYTTDGWATSQRAPLSYLRYFRVGYAHYIMSPNQFDVDKWETSVQVPFEVNTIEYAVVYTTGGQEYWDNNFGKNYVINKASY